MYSNMTPKISSHSLLILVILKSRQVDGKYKFWLELNLKRGRERRPPENIDSLQLPYDSNKFNFTKIKENEILCVLTYVNQVADEVFDSSGISSKLHKEEDDKNVNASTLLVNVSPLGYGHVLLVPERFKQIPQRLSLRAVNESIHLILLTSPLLGFRIGFNSLCALASVNHQHVHGWYLPRRLCTESASVNNLYGGILFETTDLPLNGFMLQLDTSGTLALAHRVFTLVNHLQQNDVAHNVFMTRGAVVSSCSHSLIKVHENEDVNKDMLEQCASENGFTGPLNLDRSTIRVYIWPRKSKIGAKFTPTTVPLFAEACAELGGHVPMYQEDRFENLTENEIVLAMKQQKLPDDIFEKLRTNICELYSNEFIITE